MRLETARGYVNTLTMDGLSPMVIHIHLSACLLLLDIYLPAYLPASPGYFVEIVKRCLDLL